MSQNELLHISVRLNVNKLLIEHLYFVISDKYIVKGKQHAKTPR